MYLQEMLNVLAGDTYCTFRRYLLYLQEILTVLAGDMYLCTFHRRCRPGAEEPRPRPRWAKKVGNKKSLKTEKGKSLASQCGFEKAASVAPGCYNHPQSQPPRPSFSRQKCILGRDSMKRRKQHETRTIKYQSLFLIYTFSRLKYHWKLK